MPEQTNFVIKRELVPSQTHVQLNFAGRLIDDNLANDVVNELASLSNPQGIVSIDTYSNGGSLYSALSIINAINTCQCQVTTILSSLAASAAASIFLHGDNMIITPTGHIMFHDAKLTFFGEKINGVINYIDFANDAITPFKIYEELLTEEELSNLSHGRDLYMTGETLYERMVESDTFRDRVTFITDLKRYRLEAINNGQSASAGISQALAEAQENHAKRVDRAEQNSMISRVINSLKP